MGMDPRMSLARSLRTRLPGGVGPCMTPSSCTASHNGKRRICSGSSIDRHLSDVSILAVRSIRHGSCTASPHGQHTTCNRSSSLDRPLLDVFTTCNRSSSLDRPLLDVFILAAAGFMRRGSLRSSTA